MDEDAVGADACLAAGAEFGGDEPLDRGLDVGVFENDKGCVATEFEAGFLNGLGAFGVQVFADGGGAGEAEVFDKFVVAELVADRWGLFGACGDDVEDSWGPASPFEEFGEGNGAEWCLGSRLADGCVACCDGGTDFARDHGDWGVPWCDCRDHALRLSDGEDAIVATGCRDGFTKCAFDGALEPVKKTNSVGDGGEGLCERLPEFQGTDCSEVVLVGPDQVCPASDEPSPLAVRRFLVLVERFLGSFNGQAGISAV